MLGHVLQALGRVPALEAWRPCAVFIAPHFKHTATVMLCFRGRRANGAQQLKVRQYVCCFVVIFDQRRKGKGFGMVESTLMLRCIYDAPFR